ncbi:ABC transporter permease [Pyrococcus furiosus DSM 3638]|uniref:Oligopeptide ABC transport system permease n=3 Tax=Pyrococcus furiosus TaxID=2261 RepID=Q8U3U6_PYRFU|nr:ABC transporter permease [Pyrococcus furiosus]AAL80483.1 oligopeptide ABC transport system permease [Pyrococcus furiosus DSM 3638]AFN03167.1 oligopeptide ABC transporter permease [Pyrococcus furiosus COM1]QEK78095.1 ABC transporter permease [Pyrococcus furiosus DSM 3638]
MKTIKLAFKNNKFKFGFGILVAFIIFGLIGPLFTPFANDGLYYEQVGRIKIASYSTKTLPPMTRENITTYTGKSIEVLHILGTDKEGKDLYTQLVYGLRTSLWIAFLAAIIGTLMGITIGFVSGYKGGIVDEILMMLVNIMLVIPSIVLLILVAAYLEARSPEIQAIIIGLTNWPWVARSVRAQTLSLKNREFVYLSKIMGLEDLRIIIEDILPNMISYIFMAGILQVSGAVLASATLDFIGLGPTTMVSLGVILQKAIMHNALQFGWWWWFIPPGLFITLIITALFFVNLGLEEVFNPRLRRE